MFNFRAKWWLRHVVHNCLAHPLLVVAEIAGVWNVKSLQELLYHFHDITVPEDDSKNKFTFTEIT